MNSALAELPDTLAPSSHHLHSAPLHKVLSVKNLSKSYNSHQTVLQDISFDLHSGEMVGVIGRSGAGKSTLLHVLNGTHSATSGEILSFPDVGTPRDVSRLKGRELSQWRSQDDFSGLLSGAAPRRADQRIAGQAQPDLNLQVVVQSFHRRRQGKSDCAAGVAEHAAARAATC